MDKIQFKHLIDTINSGIGDCESREDVVALVQDTSDGFLNKTQLNVIVDKLCMKYGISDIITDETSDFDSKANIIKNYLDAIDGKEIRRIKEGTDTQLLAEAILAKYNNIGRFSSAKFKLIADRLGYVVAPSFKSTAKMFNLID